MKKMRVVSAMCMFIAVGAFAGIDPQPWVLDVSARLTTLTGVTLSNAWPEVAQPQTPSAPYHSPLTTVSLTGYLCLDVCRRGVNLDPSATSATFVLVDPVSRSAWFEPIPAMIWTDGRTVMVLVGGFDTNDGLFENIPLFVVGAAFGTISFDGDTLRSLSATGNLISDTLYDGEDYTSIPATGNLSLRSDRRLTRAALDGEGSGPEAVYDFLTLGLGWRNVNGYTPFR